MTQPVVLPDAPQKRFDALFGDSFGISVRVGGGGVNPTILRTSGNEQERISFCVEAACGSNPPNIILRGLEELPDGFVDLVHKYVGDDLILQGYGLYRYISLGIVSIVDNQSKRSLGAEIIVGTYRCTESGQEYLHGQSASIPIPPNEIQVVLDVVDECVEFIRENS